MYRAFLGSLNFQLSSDAADYLGPLVWLAVVVILLTLLCWLYLLAEKPIGRWYDNVRFKRIIRYNNYDVPRYVSKE